MYDCRMRVRVCTRFATIYVRSASVRFAICVAFCTPFAYDLFIRVRSCKIRATSFVYCLYTVYASWFMQYGMSHATLGLHRLHTISIRIPALIQRQIEGLQVVVVDCLNCKEGVHKHLFFSLVLSCHCNHHQITCVGLGTSVANRSSLFVSGIAKRFTLAKRVISSPSFVVWS
jgi:hypothetical protein